MEKIGNVQDGRLQSLHGKESAQAKKVQNELFLMAAGEKIPKLKYCNRKTEKTGQIKSKEQVDRKPCESTELYSGVRCYHQ